MVRKLAGGVITLLMAACGDGERHEYPPQSFDTPESVLKAVAVSSLGSHFPRPPEPLADELLRLQQDAARCFEVSPREAQSCEDSGTVETKARQRIDAASPYTDERFLVRATAYDHCIRTSRCNFFPYEEFHGLVRSGCPVSQWDDGACAEPRSGRPGITYLSQGTREVPFLIRRRQELSGGQSVTYESSMQSEVHVDRRPGQSDDTTTVSRFSGSTQIGGRLTRHYQGFTGRPTAPYRARVTESGTRAALSIEGPLAYRGNGCDVNEFYIQTLEPIEYSWQPFAASELLSGTVRVSSGGRNIGTVRIGPGELVVRDAFGREKSFAIDGPTLYEAVGDCLYVTFRSPLLRGAAD